MIVLHPGDARSLHAQIRDGIKELILSGVWKEGEQLPSVRELSVRLTVNPNTVQHAMRELEAEGFIHSVQGKGSFVSPFSHCRKKDPAPLYKTLRDAVRELSFIGETPEAILGAAHDAIIKKEESL